MEAMELCFPAILKSYTKEQRAMTNL